MDSLYLKLKNLNLFIENEYFIKYVQLMSLNKLTIPQKFVTQKHHIIPKYYFKKNNLVVDNSKNNIVNLQYKDHVLAHYFLINCCSNEDDVLSNIHAFNILLRKQGHNLEESDLNSLLLIAEQLEQKRLTHMAKVSKLKNSGGKYINKDGVVKHIKEDELALYLADGWQLGNPKAAYKDRDKRYCITNEVIFKRVKQDELNTYLKAGWRLGTPKLTAETKQKIAIGTRGHKCNTKNKIVITKNGKNKFIDQVDLNKYLADNWHIGSKSRSDEFKKLISKQKIGRIWVTNEQGIKMINKDDLEYYLAIGYVKGRSYEKNTKK